MNDSGTRSCICRTGKRIAGMVALLLLAACTESALFAVNSLARTDNFAVVEDIAYGRHPMNRLDMYLPGQDQAPRATVVFFYGGCWGGCETKNKEQYVFVAQALTSHGYAVVIPDYRRYPEVKFDRIIDDARRAVEWLKANGAEYGADSDAIFLMGHSAGAHLGAMLTLNENYLLPETFQSLKGFIGLAGPYDFLPFTEAYQKAVFGPEEKYPASQPVNFVQGTEPPLLLLYGDNDVTVKPINIKSLSDKVRDAAGCVETRLYDDLDHIDLLAALALPLQGIEPVLPDIIEFIDYYAQPYAACKTVLTHG
ncbi:MAG: alpha/beta hydrolase [Methylobacter sp.]|uniref:alpha/beta hydrolase n=1 Tax=Methylobacter sp. TaxID=2051955 RepID=UPI00258B93A1|nr:alpha/beta hydrolase [Methylobacter sp.]MCL7422831.1 alpha/beta hydrolase [Methylobacter sp.]